MFSKTRILFTSILLFLICFTFLGDMISQAKTIGLDHLRFLPLIQNGKIILPSATLNPTNTPTATIISCLTPLCTPPPSSTSIPTSTSTPTSLPIRHTLTPSLTATPICPIYGSPFTVKNNHLSLGLTNAASSETYEITNVYISWPDTPTQNLLSLDLDENIFWSGIQATSPFSENDGWIGPDTYRQIPPNSTAIFTFTFSESLPFSSYFIQIGFANGCSVTLGN